MSSQSTKYIPKAMKREGHPAHPPKNPVGTQIAKEVKTCSKCGKKTK